MCDVPTTRARAKPYVCNNGRQEGVAREYVNRFLTAAGRDNPKSGG